MSHIPVNHHMRPLCRAVAVVTGAYVLVFGVIGVIQSGGSDLFERDDVVALGLRTNLAFSIASLVVGGLILLSVVVGRNVDYVVNVWGGVAFMVVGVIMLALLNTDLNVLNFSVATVIVSFLIGLVLFSVGLYVRSGSPARSRAEEAVRHGGH